MKLPVSLIKIMENWESSDAYGDIRITYVHGKVAAYAYGCKVKVEETLTNVDQVPKKLIRRKPPIAERLKEGKWS